MSVWIVVRDDLSRNPLERPRPLPSAGAVELFYPTRPGKSYGVSYEVDDLEEFDTEEDAWAYMVGEARQKHEQTGGVLTSLIIRENEALQRRRLRGG